MITYTDISPAVKALGDLHFKEVPRDTEWTYDHKLPTVCGREDRGNYHYMAFQRGDEGGSVMEVAKALETRDDICPECREKCGVYYKKPGDRKVVFED